MGSFIELIGVTKSYRMGEVTVNALDGATFHIEEGEFALIVGPSGAGKSTVLNILGGMDTSDRGEIIVDGRAINTFSRNRLIAYRRYDIGFVFQFYNLMQNLTALENVELASQISRRPLDPRAVLGDVGLGHRMSNFPAQLSGGEQQRVSIARAIAKNPKLLLCDEPTGALDYVTGKGVLGLLRDICRDRGIVIVLITHNLAIMPMADRVIRMKNGAVESITVNSSPVPIDDIEW
ncbi:MAG: ABC transporter ATP-binding protein [Oscillospiraceae bacterium]|nr:ABC transporter ATP-binding protein [Oscillospiraceae bacterium]